MSSVLTERIHDRFPKKWLMVLVLFVSAELPGAASGENPAPGTGAPSAFNGTPARISF
jgi:L-asparagine transporter-like permease